MDSRLPHHFGEMAKRDSRRADQPPNAIPASALDENFQTCLPKTNEGFDRPYDITVDKSEGWTLRGRTPFMICENGKPAIYMFFATRMAEQESS
jgi:hypothetical protein